VREVQTECKADFVSAQQLDFGSNLDSTAGFNDSEPLPISRKWHTELDTADGAEAVKSDLTQLMANGKFAAGAVFVVKKPRSCHNPVMSRRWGNAE